MCGQLLIMQIRTEALMVCKNLLCIFQSALYFLGMSLPAAVIAAGLLLYICKLSCHDHQISCRVMPSLWHSAGHVFGWAMW